MKKGKKQIIALDVDEVLFDCIPKVLKEAEKYGVHVDYEDITEYDFHNLAPQVRELFFKMMNEPTFYQTQAPIDGAVEMVNELLDAGHEVVIASAVPPMLMSYRSELLMKVFPRLKPQNIMLGARKDLLHVDFLLDDALHNISASPAKYPVLFTHPWNVREQNYLRVSSYREFLQMVEAVSLAPASAGTHLNQTGRPGLLCLVGPSASGKSFISDELIRNPLFRKVRAVTTREPRAGEGETEYFFVDDDTFAQYVESSSLVEHTTYQGSKYGILKQEIEDIWKAGRIAIKPVDIHGAMACKAAYGDRCVTVFIRRDKKAVVKSLLERAAPSEDTAKRILSLDTEYDNEALCDWTVFNNGNLDNAVQQIMRLVY